MSPNFMKRSVVVLAIGDLASATLVRLLCRHGNTVRPERVAYGRSSSPEIRILTEKR